MLLSSRLTEDEGAPVPPILPSIRFLCALIVKIGSIISNYLAGSLERSSSLETEERLSLARLALASFVVGR